MKNRKNKKLTKVELAKIGVISFGTASVSVFTIIEIIQFLIGDSIFFSSWPTLTKVFVFLGVVFIIVLCAICTFIWNSYQELSGIYASTLDPNGIDHKDSLVLILESAYNAGHWQEVVKIGSTLSEPLWYTGKYEILVKIGEMVESAAGLCEEYEIQAETLLDDLGWTRVRLNEISAGKKNIIHGLRIANDHNLFYLVAKGYRHLADIHLAEACNFWTLRYMDWGSRHMPKVITKTNDLFECFAYYEKGMAILPSILDDKKRIEMEGNLKYTLAKYYLVKKDFKKALQAVSESQSLYASISDADREVKLFNLKGKIYMEMGNESEAESTYQEGLRKSTTISNNAHMVSNSISLAEYYLLENKCALAKKMLSVANDNAKTINDPILSAKIEDLRVLIEVGK